nr:hypothetical protein [Nitrospinaceae bacterium]NIR56733.1 hypothetical protein [Nitrospinaceae bacterium]NIS87182.1 hypothetical protein [Nitrospinaceae bacterium]NIT84051.1 hypothetical protein [Nitrospinaceae bacterium]NIU46234.1 hypothetical protein [Nitrospinaceae bacterium]
TEDPAQDVQFRLGHPIPIAFNAWDGGQKETGSRKSVSSWYELILE